MKTYQLENKETDARFLNGEQILCPAVIPVNSLLNAGDRLVIILSSGKKYMADVKHFDYTVTGSHAEGQLQVVRRVKK